MPEISQEQFAEVVAARSARPPVSFRVLAKRYGVSHTSLTRRYARHQAALAAEVKAERAAKAAEDPRRPETTRLPGEPIDVIPTAALTRRPKLDPPPGAPEGAVVVPYGTGGIGSWWAAREIEQAVPEQYPNSTLVGVKELVEDRRANMDLTEKIRAHPAPDPMRPHR